MEARAFAWPVVSRIRRRAQFRRQWPASGRSKGTRWRWALPVGLLLLLPGFPEVVHAQQGGTVELVFELPPGFSPDNLPANLDDTQQEEIVLGSDYLATASVLLGSLDELVTAPVEPAPAPSSGEAEEGNRR